MAKVTMILTDTPEALTIEGHSDNPTEHCRANVIAQYISDNIDAIGHQALTQHIAEMNAAMAAQRAEMSAATAAPRSSEDEAEAALDEAAFAAVKDSSAIPGAGEQT